MLHPFQHWKPQLGNNVFAADSADIIGRVCIGDQASIWHQSVLRGDVEDIIIGARSNIQDHSTVHTSHGITPCIIGDDVTIGHRVILHGCEVQSFCLIGMGSIIMDQAIIEEGCLLAAGSLVTERKVLRSGYLYAGSPAKEIRKLRDDEQTFLRQSAAHYVQLAKQYLQA